MKAGSEIISFSNSQYEEASGVLKSLAHPERLKILCHLADGEKSVSELEAVCEASQSHVSQFLSRMKLEGILSSRRESQFVFYKIQDSKVQQIVKALQQVFCKK